MTGNPEGGEPAWTPSPDRVAAAQLSLFLNWLTEHRGITFGGYLELWRWSVTETGSFWAAAWEYFGMSSATPFTSVFEGSLTDQRWFTGATLNYVGHALAGHDAGVALICGEENGRARSLTRRQLRDQAAALAATLTRLGVSKGDRVAAILPNRAEAVVGFLATASIGAVWSICSPDLGDSSIVDRFAQITPKILIVTDGYTYGGRFFDVSQKISRVRAAIPSVEATVLVPAAEHSELPATVSWADCLAEPAPPLYAQVPFDHPLWVVYTSGTTGPPKPIVHGHGGVLLALNVFLGLHLDISRSDVFFWYTSTGWVMWNILVGGLLRGATCVLYDGSPGYPDASAIWELAAREKVSVLGVSAAYLQHCMQSDLVPRARLDLSSVRTLGSTGSPLPPAAYHWALRAVGPDILVASVSGGTDICCAWVASCPTLPVYAGEIQCATLGAAVAIYDDDGQPVLGEAGELVVRKAFPSMPVGFWGDPGGIRMHESYFAAFPGAWRHGDWARQTQRGGFIIYGRSDATLNRGGIRMGTSEFYRIVEAQPEIADSLIVDVTENVYSSKVILFVVLAAGCDLTEQLDGRLRGVIRAELSPRHAPDQIVALTEIPYTLTGKKCEIPVKRILQGAQPGEVSSKGALRNPGSLQQFIRCRELI